MSNNPLANLFGKSPIRPMQEHMRKAHSCAEALNPFFDAAEAGDWQQAAACQQTVTRLENEADKLKKDLRLHLPKSLFLPVPRSDLLDLLSMQDKVANCAKDIAGLMLGRRMQLPETIAAQMRDYLNLALATSAQALKAIDEMDELLETGFRGREVKLVEGLIEELDRLEHQNDEMQIVIRAELFSIEETLPPVQVMFVYRIIDLIGELADRAQKVGARLQLLLAR